MTKLNKLIQIAEPQLGYRANLETPKVKASPFVKWAGGKRNLLPTIEKHMPPKKQINRYFEPFVGGGALFFHFQHPRSFLSDQNRDLIEVYRIVRDSVEELLDALSVHRNEEEYFYKVRAQDPAKLSSVERAARFIFMNKTCFNGLYRVNSKGIFNVPFGKYKNPRIRDEEGLRSASLALQDVELASHGFENILDIADGTDFVYFDPPYHPISSTSSFTSYTAKNFGEDAQKRLGEVATELAKRGCLVLLSNSDTHLIREIYENGYFKVFEVQANRSISSKASGRGKISELLIRNYYSANEIP